MSQTDHKIDMISQESQSQEVGSPSLPKPREIIVANENDHAIRPVSTISKLRAIMNQANDDSLPQENSYKPRIQRVPKVLREARSSNGYYDPILISIGPYHYMNEKFQSMQKQKEKMMRDYIHSLRCDVEEVYNNVLDVIDKAKGCYVLDATEKSFLSDDDTFRYVMFVDGCFLVHFILGYDGSDPNMKKMKMFNASWIVRDLFLLENQLPFSVIKRLMVLKGYTSNDAIFKIIKHFINTIRPMHQERSIFHMPHRAPKPTNWEVWDEPLHLLHVLQMRVIDKTKLKPEDSKGKHDDWYCYSTATALKAAGIKFRCGYSHHFNDVSFKSSIHRGILTLTPMTIDEMSEPTLRNLVALEALPDAPDDLGITSYLCLLDTLIDDAEDVRVLRSERIIRNLLGSDQQVADLFNKITQGLVPNPDVFAMVQRGIDEHYQDTGKAWMNEWLHTHFSSPWTVLAFLGALLALGLSVAQTYYAAISSNKGSGPNPPH